MDIHDYAGPADVRAMQELAREVWSPDSRWHIGDLAYGRFQHLGRERDWPTRLWRSGGRTLAWGWIELPHHLSLQVHPRHPELAGEVLAWFDRVTRAAGQPPGAAGTRHVTVLETQSVLLDALHEAGYRPVGSDAPFFERLARGLADLPTPDLPDGLRLRHLRGPADAPARAAVHARAFAPSRVSAESYRAVMAAWPYRPELDWVVQAPDGHFVAYATGWFDERHRVGLFEPVGTDPDHRGQGLARAVCLAAMHALAAAGADEVNVVARGDLAYPVPARLYRSLGFQPTARTVTMARTGRTARAGQLPRG